MAMRESQTPPFIGIQFNLSSRFQGSRVLPNTDTYVGDSHNLVRAQGIIYLGSYKMASSNAYFV